MWQNTDVALALHRARALDATRGGRARRRRPERLARTTAALRPAAAPGAR